MIYPKIYSLSTVGIVKHYNHDYIFHHKRTDFIGPNGVGKSILADLMQMMFVYDKDLIKFGTVDVKGERHIHTLPYKTRCAYCFLNIIISDTKFITIGIQINGQTGKRIIPFIITKDTDLTKDKQQLSLDQKEILFASDFIINGTIPDIQELAQALNDSRNLKLQHFRTKDEIQRYYRFLNEQSILPINLALDKNLKAYAKVIQSFSKAQSLKLSGDSASKNLKEFLFEDSNEDMLATFELEKFELEKVLKEYNRLNTDIKLLGQKQTNLTELHQLNENRNNKWKKFKTDEISNCYLSLLEQGKIEVHIRQIQKQQQEALNYCEKIIAKLPSTQSRMKTGYDNAELNYGLVSKYISLVKTIEEVNDQITELKMVVLPVVHDNWKSINKVDISVRSVNDIKNEIAFATHYINEYETLHNIEDARNKQNREIDQLKTQLESEKIKKEKLIQLLQTKGHDSLLHWFFNNLPKLNEKQTQVILHFATLPIDKTAKPNNQDRFISPGEIKDFEIIETKNGLWVKSGAMSEFIIKNPDADLLHNRESLKANVQQLTHKINEELKSIEIKCSALNNIRDSLNYDTSLFDIIFDPRISERASIDHLKTAISCILLRDDKVAELQRKKALDENELIELQDQFGLRYKEPEVIERDLKKIKDRWFKRLEKLSKYAGGKDREKDALQKEVKRINFQVEETANDIIKLQGDFNQLHITYYKDFQENIAHFNEAMKEIEESKEEFEKAFSSYMQYYIETANGFDETRQRKNVEVNYELEKNSYSFVVLERALLGNKVKTADDITTALQEANNNRTQIADSIRDNMLKIFGKITDNYKNNKIQIQNINAFFINRKISGKFYFNVKFEENKEINIDYINNLAYSVRQSATRGELQFDQSITDFLEEFFRKMARLKDRIPIGKLLDPRTYFELSAKLEDEFGAEVPGSTGESYSAIALLGIARLSTQKSKQEGLRFIILEELGSIDNTNFNIFPAIAEEFQYQIITMAPHAFNIGLSDEWYAHHLIKGKDDGNINYYPSSSYFKTKGNNEQLNVYLNKIKK
ncbi:MAG: hypothetical protein V4556_07635 [Bacteroidota bacterium]